MAHHEPRLSVSPTCAAAALRGVRCRSNIDAVQRGLLFVRSSSPPSTFVDARRRVLLHEHGFLRTLLRLSSSAALRAPVSRGPCLYEHPVHGAASISTYVSVSGKPTPHTMLALSIKCPALSPVLSAQCSVQRQHSVLSAQSVLSQWLSTQCSVQLSARAIARYSVQCSVSARALAAGCDEMLGVDLGF